MNLKTIILSFLFLYASFLTKASIIDTNNNTFIDTQTSLEWLDFGVNNGETFNYVSNQLGEGDKYSGWMLPTETEVKMLWNNAFYSVVGGDLSIDLYGTGYHRHDLLNDMSGSSSFDAIFNTMGNNGLIGGNNYAWAWFLGEDSHLKAFHFHDSSNANGVDKTYIKGNYDSWKYLQSPYYSTMLVRSADLQSINPISEPPIYFLLVLICLYSLCRRSKLKVNH